MRRRPWSRPAGLALAAMAVAAAAPVARPRAAIAVPGGSLSLVQQGERTAITLRAGGVARRTILAREDGVHAGAEPATRLVGALPGRVLVLDSDYASNPAGGSAQCGAGVETVVRVLAVRPALRQTFSQRIASCWHGIDGEDPAWDPRTRILTLERTAPDPARPGLPAQHLRIRYRVDPDGTVTPRVVDRLPD